MWSNLILCCVLISSSIIISADCQENDTTIVKKQIVNDDEEDNAGSFFDFFSTKNRSNIQTISSGNNNNTHKNNISSPSEAPTQRITQPLAQAQQIESTILNPTQNKSLNFNNSSRSSSSSLPVDFKPSPHLETYYEFNKFPVIPALPEPKTISTNLFVGDFPQSSRPSVWPQQHPSFTTTTQPSTWSARVKFPEPSIHTVKDRPYQFYNNEEKKSPSPQISSAKNFPAKSSANLATWDRFQNKKTGYQQQFDFQAPVEVHHHRPSGYGASGYGANHGDGSEYVNGHGDAGGYDYGLMAVEKPQKDVMKHQENPWKKIIKFLTAFIPIGLLISALTPTVITVQSVNGTQTRSRAEDSLAKNTKHLVSSLGDFGKIGSLSGCEDRILCELLLSASTSKNAEQHVNNLLNTFTENGKVDAERAEELKKIFTAVKKEDCSPIQCKNIKKG